MRIPGIPMWIFAVWGRTFCCEGYGPVYVGWGFESFLEAECDDGGEGIDGLGKQDITTVVVSIFRGECE